MAENRMTVAHPGRYGDLFWALPTVRFLTEQHGEPARLLLPTDPANTTPWAPVLPLLRAQPYIAEAAIVPEWSITQDAPRMPKVPPGVDVDYAPGYESWPQDPLPYEAARLCGVRAHAADPELDAEYFRPWIQLPRSTVANIARGVFPYPTVVVHWTDRYFELKLGILSEIRRLLPGVRLQWYAQDDSRMQQAGARPCGWLELAEALEMAEIVLTDCSAAHVLAAAVGVRRVLVVEPEEARHHEVFWPGSLTKLIPWQPRDTTLGRRIRPVLGSDGRPTFDARHVVYEITRALEEK